VFSGPIGIGEKTYLYSFVHDITEKLRAEESLKISEARFRKLAETSKTIFWEFDPIENLWLYVSPQVNYILGYEPSEWTNFEFWADRIHYDDKETTIGICNDASARGEDHEMEYRFLKPNGEVVWLREEVNVETKDGKPFRMRGTMMDITSRKVAEIALKQSESNLKEAQKIALLGRWEHNIATDELYWSDMVFEIFGKAPRTYKPDLNSFLSYIHPEDKEFVQKAYFSALNNNSTYKVEHRLLMPDGNIKWVVEEANLFYNQNGEPYRSVGIVQDITQRKLIELALKASEQKFQALFNNLTVGVSLISPNMELLQVNPKIKEWFPKGDYNNKTFCYCTFSIPPLDKPCDKCPVKKTFIDGEIHEAERQVDTPRGIMYFRVVSTPIFNESGKVEAAVEMMDNITARKIAEIALKDSEHKHRTLFETMEQGVVYQDAKGFIFSANKAAQRILGLSLKQMQGRESTDVRWRAVKEDGSDYPSEEHPSMVALRTGKLVKNAIMGIFHPTENDYKWILVNAVPEFEGNNKNPYRVYVTFTDITQRKKHEKELKEQKDFLETLMQTIPNPIFYKDKEGKYIGCNKAFENYVGLSEKNIVGKTVFDISSKRYAPVYKKWDTTLLRTLKNQHYEWIVERSNGQVRDVIFDKAPIFNAKGEVSGIIGVITDISDRKKAEQEVKSNTERLKALVRIFEHKANSVKPLLDYALTEALNLTSSSIGYLYLYDEQKEQFTLNSWSKNVMEQCSIANPQTCYELSKTGIWGEVVRQRKEIVVNNFQAKHPLKKGYPDGHAQLNRFMSIPVIIDEKIVAVVGVGNKTEEYNETDLNQLKLLMGSVWGIVQRREDSEKISKLSIAVEQSSASIVITDMNGNIEYVNPKFTEITGYSFEEAVGENPRVLNAGFHDKEFFKEMWETIVKGKDWKGQLVNKKKNGELYWESASISPIRNSDGKVINFIAIKDDITELKRAEEALQDSELKLRRMIEQSPDGIMLTDENGRVVAWNKALESISQIPASKAIGVDLIEFHKLLPTKNKSKLRDKDLQRLIVELISAGKTDKFSLNKIHEIKLYVDNKERIIQLMVFVIPSERGNMLASFARDITMQKKAELEIREREEKLQAIFDNSIQSFVILSKDLIVQAYNYVAWERAKYFFEKEFAVGKSIYDVYPNSIVHEVMREANKVIDGEATRYEMPMKDQSDNTFWFELHFSPVFDENKNVVSIFFNSIDITQRKLAEESMARSLEKEKELSELKSRFVSTVSHEFRTPLASIFSNTQLLHRYHTKWEEEKKNLSFRRIYESVNLMTGMLENVSLIGKEQNGRFTFRPEVINLNEFVKQVVDESHLTLSESNRVELSIEDNFERVLIDQILLRHILINILTNAIKYSKGGPLVIFNIRTVKRFIEFYVKDSGIGIPAKELNKIYDPFFRASNSEDYSGTGLGMAIVKQCVDTHSGKISVKSVINKGTIVKVLLPFRAL
jgi:PAS domain S-box-containing protein